MAIYHDVKQRSDEWFRLRAGIPTASEIKRIVTPTGRLSKQADDYMDSLLAEWAFGGPLQDPETEYQSQWMQRGEFLEGQAADAYAFMKDAELETVGFVTDDKGVIGCSPDRLIVPDGILEIKCPSPKVHLRYMRTGAIEDEYRPQLQLQLLITERQYVDIISYCPGFPSVIIRQERDDAFQEILISALGNFVAKLLEARERLLERFPAIKERQEAMAAA